MTRQAIYDRLRAIGVTVESADAVAEALEPLPDKKVEAFLLCINGYTQKQASLQFNIPLRTLERLINQIKVAVK